MTEHSNGKGAASWGNIVEEYNYCSADGNQLYQVCRFGKGGKSFPTRHKDSEDRWIPGQGPHPAVLYNLPALAKATPDKTVYICEGEKDVNTLTRLGRLAVCALRGATKWDPSYNDHLTGRKIVILEDNDEPGQKHGRATADSLHGTAKAIKIIRFPNLPQHGDISDFVNNRKEGLEDFNNLQKEAAIYTGNYSEYFNEPEPVVADPSNQEEEIGSENEEEGVVNTLIKIASSWEKFHDIDKICYVTMKNGITSPVESDSVALELRGQYYKTLKSGVSDFSIKGAIQTIKAQALFDGPEKKVFLRMGKDGQNYYIDLANGTGSMVEINEEGWNILEKPKIKFIRRDNMREIKEPRQVENFLVPLDCLKKTLNLSNQEDNWKLTLVFLVYCFSPDGPYPILLLQGPEGSGKSVFCKMLKRLLDPTKADASSLPKKEEDIVTTAKNNHIMAYDNLRGLSQEISDSLCRISTGASFTKRKLYTDSEEFSSEVCRPLIMNGINTIAKEADLADRCIRLEFALLADAARIAENDLWEKIDELHPEFIGAILSLLSKVLKVLPNIKLEKPTRMMSYAKFGVACEEVCGWGKGTFMDAYLANKQESVEINMEDNDFMQEVLQIVEGSPDLMWKGTSGEILTLAKSKYPDERPTFFKFWPARGKVKDFFRRHLQSLKSSGYGFKELPRTKTGRSFLIFKIKKGPESSDPDRFTDAF